MVGELIVGKGVAQHHPTYPTDINMLISLITISMPIV